MLVLENEVRVPNTVTDGAWGWHVKLCFGDLCEGHLLGARDPQMIFSVYL